MLSAAPTVTRGRHRAARRPGRVGRAALAVVAAGAPVVPAVLLAAPAAHADTDWDALAECESSGNWSTNTGNGFGGGLQFTDSTWRAFGGSGQPEDASRSEQIRVAERVKAEQGMNAWPTCSRRTGQTDNSPNTGSSGSSDDESADSDDSDSGNSDSGSSSETRQVRDSDSSSSASTSSSVSSYTVRNGDTLSSIAAAHGATWRSLAQANTDVLSDPNMIFPGQTLSMS
ncbi:LysM peptidoglycan-binding domain-containing protein [Actinomycetospora aeridis]|uniref:Transglycosylase family protein n=1 Tax=Actinomycetospora aeridis TaxID=3129231 RepID=A0ABU8NFD0_9PSEU